MVIVILIVLGLCLGSFVNAFVWRFHEQEELRHSVGAKTKKKSEKTQLTASKLSISKGRSMCVHCHHELAVKDLAPVLSYLSLGGKCRYCKQPIQDTPLAELVTPALFVLSYVYWPQELTGVGLFTFVMWLVFVVGFVALSLYDIRWYLLPHKIVLPLSALAAVQVLIVAFVSDSGLSSLLRAVWGVVFIAGVFWVISYVSPKQTVDVGTPEETKISKWIGGGDITLGILLGLLVGGPANALMVVFIASIIGTLIALPLMAMGKAHKASYLPFGPFLMAAAVIVMLFGAKLIDWYSGLLIV